MHNFVKFIDAVNFVPCEVTQETRDYYDQAVKDGVLEVKPLQIRIAATHAGKVTRNNGLYLPHKMQAGVSSFTDQYPKPIQVHHQDKEDPIGRILEARYIDISHGMRNVVKDATERLSLLDAFIAGTLSTHDSINFANTWLINDLKVSTDPNYEGLGYIELVANITNPEAIQKVLDGRYLTGSVGASTDSAICSICKKDWAADGGKCKHKPGQIYDSAKCVIIAGDLSYDEYSFVNRPADRHSRIIEVNVNGVQDFVSCDEESGAATLSLLDDEKTSIATFFGDTYNKIIGNNPEGKLYAEMMYTLLDNVDSKDLERIGQEVREATLTAEEREQLSSSVFCGPDRSFPVNDCKHYVAALRLLNRYEGTGDKERIKSCIERKGKRMGCVSEQKDFTMDDFTVEAFDKHTDEEITKLFSVLKTVLEERKLCGCADQAPVTESQPEVTDAQQEVTEALVPAVETEAVVVAESTENPQIDSTENSELQTRLENLQKEVRFLHHDMELLTSSAADHMAEARAARMAHLTDLHALTKHDTEVTAFADSLKDKTYDELGQVLADFATKVDIQKIVDMLSSGLSNLPTEAVEDPTMTQDNTVVANGGAVSDRQKQQLRVEWLKIRSVRGKEVADRWLDDAYKALNLDTVKVES